MKLEARLIEEYWHLLCHKSEVANGGDFVRFESILGDIVVHNDGKSVIAFDNLCPHRGAKIYDGPHGRRSATCPYHGWTYRAGRMFVACRERFAHIDSKSIYPNFYKTEWLQDFLFVSIRPRLPLLEQLGKFAQNLSDISLNIANKIDHNNFMYECHWPVAVENALEPYHISRIHTDTLGLLEIGDGKNDYENFNSAWSAPICNKRIEKALKQMSSYFDINGAFSGYQSFFLFPFTMISSTFGYSYSLQNYLPAGEGQTFFYSRLFASRLSGEKSKRITESFFQSTINTNRKVFDEDHDVCRLVPRSSWNMAPLRFPADNEEKIDHFRSACRSHASNF